MEKKQELTRYEMQSQYRIKQLIQEYCDGSQQRFVEKTGINKGSISQYINGKNTPSNITAKKIADAFQVAPAWIMGFDVPRTILTPADDETKTDEAILISSFRELTSEGQKKALEYLIDLNQNMKYSAKLQSQQARFDNGEEIKEYDDAMSFLEQSNISIAACSGEKLSAKDVIAMANALKFRKNT